MERGAQVLARMLLIAAILGLAMLLAHPDYRAAAAALARGRPETSPIWLSNQSYYTEVTLNDEARP
jgi:hypothetical protein